MNSVLILIFQNISKGNGHGGTVAHRLQVLGLLRPHRPWLDCARDTGSHIEHVLRALGLRLPHREHGRCHPVA
jgi:hypothetical protein